MCVRICNGNSSDSKKEERDWDFDGIHVCLCVRTWMRMFCIDSRRAARRILRGLETMKRVEENDNTQRKGNDLIFFRAR